MIYGYFGDLKEFSFVESETPKNLSLLRRIELIFTRNYHFLGLLKKIISVVVMIQLGDKAKKLEILGGIHFAMLLLTMSLRPYNNHFLNLGKVTSDFILVIYVLTLYEIERQF